MSSNSTECSSDDKLCIAREHQLAVIIVPSLLLIGTFITLIIIFILLYCPQVKQRRVKVTQRHHSSSHRHTQRDQQHHHHHHHHNHRPHQNNHHPNHNRHDRRHLRGIDAPPGINPLEHEELPMSVQPVQRNVRPTLAAPPPSPPVLRERQRTAFSQVTALPHSFSARPNEAVTLYRARMENRGVVLRALKDTASSREKRHFLGFASFVSRLGPHPFLPALLGVVSVRPPLMMVMEELQYRDLLGFLWRCRQENAGSQHMTEKTIFTMAGQVSSALKYLHSRNCVHGNVGARSVLVGRDLTAKLWGLGPAYRRQREAGSPGEVEDMELKKWQAPEVLSRRMVSPRADVWSFGVLLYEMVTLGDAPFAEVLATDLVQHLQRGNHLQRPAGCSSSLFAIIRSCCRWNSENRLSVSDLGNKLLAGEKSANGRTVLRAPRPINIERYLREAGYGEAYNYAVL